jgi:hypothetical protein
LSRSNSLVVNFVPAFDRGCFEQWHKERSLENVKGASGAQHQDERASLLADRVRGASVPVQGFGLAVELLADRAIARADDASSAAAISVAAFGGAGTELAAVVRTGAAGIDYEAEVHRRRGGRAGEDCAYR